jgi:hypothetical protein
MMDFLLIGVCSPAAVGSPEAGLPYPVTAGIATSAADAWPATGFPGKIQGIQIRLSLFRFLALRTLAQNVLYSLQPAFV